MATPPNPVQTTPMMQQAQQAMNNPMGAPVSPGGGIDPSIHPIVGQIVRALQAAASGYGWTAMSPQEREQRTALQQQKAEALGRQAIAQQQLGLESQRVGLEGQRVGIAQQEATEAGRHNIAAEATAGREAGARESEAATAAERAKTEKENVEQTHKEKQRELDRADKEFQQDYGPGGFKSRQIASEEKQAGASVTRANAEQELNGIIRARDQETKEYHDASLKAQGLVTDRQALEDQRKERYKSSDEALDTHYYWFDSKEDLNTRKAQEHAKIDADINAQIREAERAAGTGVGAARTPYANQGPQPPAATGEATHFYYNPDGTRAGTPVTGQGTR